MAAVQVNGGTMKGIMVSWQLPTDNANMVIGYRVFYKTVMESVYYSVSTVKHLLFVWPYFRETDILDIFTRPYFRNLPDRGV